MFFLKKLRNYFNITQEELAKKLEVDTFTVSQYEMGKNMPSFKILLKIVDFFQISLDYLLLEEKCFYPKNIKLLDLAKKLDIFPKSDARDNLVITTRTFFNNQINENIDLKSDLLDSPLTEIFHTNLKNIRNHKKLSQKKLGEKINISGPLIAMYEKKTFPSREKIINLSNTLNISVHALATGNKLSFDFQDKYFGVTILLADHYLSLEDHKIIIKLIQNIISSQK